MSPYYSLFFFSLFLKKAQVFKRELDELKLKLKEKQKGLEVQCV